MISSQSPEAARQLRLLARGKGLLRHRVEADARRQHQALLRSRHGDIHAPFVMAIVGACEAGDRIDQEERGMIRGVDGAPHGRDVRGDARRRLVVHDANRLDRALRVGAQALLDHLRLHPAPPAFDARQAEELGLEAQALRHLFPERGEVPGFEHQDGVAGTERVDERRFPGARARRRIDDDRLLRLEDLLDPFEHCQAERAEFGATMVDGRVAHRAQDAIRHRARSGDLQEVSSGGVKV